MPYVLCRNGENKIHISVVVVSSAHIFVPITASYIEQVLEREPQDIMKHI